MKYKLIIGSHVRMTKENKYLIGSVEEAIKYGSNAFMIYTSSPRIIKNKPELKNMNIFEFHNILQKNNINIKNIIIHASYLINLGNTINSSVYNLSINLLKEEIYRAIKIGIETIVLHPGSSLGANRTNSLLKIANALNMILKPEYKIKIALELMSGKGNEIGKNFDELKFILDNVKIKSKVGICLDTCHLNDAGYDIKFKFEDVLSEFNKKIGINKIFVVHLNDSKNILNSHKDRHENIGYGTIGFDALMNIAYHKKLENIPKILETPFINEKKIPPYKYEINNFINKKFISFKQVN